MSAEPPVAVATPQPAQEPPLWSLSTLKFLVGKLAIPATLLLMAHWFTQNETERASADQNSANQRAMQDGRLKVYTELLNKREESDMGVRSQVFSTLLGNYFDPKKSSISQRMTTLDLLAANFDESLNLSPLFWQLDRELTASHTPDLKESRERLSGIASTVKQRQIDTLSARGASTSWDIYSTKSADEAQPDARVLRFGTPSAQGSPLVRECSFSIYIFDRDPLRRRILAQVETDSTVTPPPSNSPCVSRNSTGELERKQWSFWVDEFDFPLVNYTRLSDTERFALVLMTAEASGDHSHIELRLVFFPSSSAGSRDRPFLDTVLNSLVQPVEKTAAAASGGGR